MTIEQPLTPGNRPLQSPVSKIRYDTLTTIGRVDLQRRRETAERLVRMRGR